MFNVPTVAAAIAPFKKVVANLQKVSVDQRLARDRAISELEIARASLSEMEIIKGKAADAAQFEAQRAEKLMAKLEALLADD